MDSRLSPIGFFNLALSYLDAADALATRQNDTEDSFHLPFEHPIRHLYAHTWELAQKACLYRQGMKPSDMKRQLGHKLTAAWDLIDKERFAPLDLHPGTRIVPEVLDRFHPTKLYAYPVTGSRHEFTITYVRRASERFKIPRSEILRLFG